MQEEKLELDHLQNLVRSQLLRAQQQQGSRYNVQSLADQVAARKREQDLQFVQQHYVAVAKGKKHKSTTRNARAEASPDYSSLQLESRSTAKLLTPSASGVALHVDTSMRLPMDDELTVNTNRSYGLRTPKFDASSLVSVIRDPQQRLAPLSTPANVLTLRRKVSQLCGESSTAAQPHRGHGHLRLLRPSQHMNLSSSLPSLQNLHFGTDRSITSGSLRLGDSCDGASVGTLSSNTQLLDPAEAAARKSVHHAFLEVFADRKHQARRRSLAMVEECPHPALDSPKHSYQKSKNLLKKYIDDVESLYNSKTPASGLVDNEFIASSQDSFVHELKSYDSLALYIEAKYIELKEHEAHHGLLPTKTKAILSADLIMKMVKGLGRYATVLEPLLWELFNCIFDGYAERECMFTIDNFATELKLLNSYFDLYHGAQSALDDVNGELQVIQQGTNMKKLVKKFQTVRLVFDEAGAFIRDACFKLWRQYTRHRAKLNQLGHRRGLRYRFNIWKEFHRNREQRAAAEVSEELDRKINRLTELNTLMEGHNADKFYRSNFGSLSRAMSTRSVDELRAPTAPMTPKTPMTPMSPMALRGKDRFNKQKEAMDSINRKLVHTLGAIAMAAASPIVSRASSVEAMPVLSNERAISLPITESNDENEELFASPRLLAADDLQAAEEEEHLQLIEQTVRLTSEFIADSHDESTQTPDDWMSDVREPIFGFLQESSPSDSQDELADPHEHTSNLPAIGEKIAEKYEMNVYAAEELVTMILESRISEAKSKGLKDDVASIREQETIMEFARKYLLSRYRLRRLASKFYKELLHACVSHARHHPRLELFALLCGLAMPGVEAKYDPFKVAFFINGVLTLFEGNIEFMSVSFAEKVIDREIVLDHMPLVFPYLSAESKDHYQDLVFELIDLPCVEETEVSYKIKIDEVLLVAMSYYDVEAQARMGLHHDFVESQPEDDDPERYITFPTGV